MIRLRVALLLFLVIYAGLLMLLAASLGHQGMGVLWVLWVGCAAIALSATAFEMALFPLSLWAKLARGKDNLFAEAYVPTELAATDKRRLEEDPPAIAILIPAHNEATTPEDREGLVQRIVSILCETPAWSTLVLLFDSPAAQQAHECWVVENVREELARRGRGAEFTRLRAEEYRDKIPSMRNKQGSIVLWLRFHATKYKYMFVLDADSWLPPMNSQVPEERDVLGRLVLAMERHPDVAMIQARVEMQTYRTIWGYFQRANKHLGSRYLRLLQWAFQGQTPSFGHNVLFRVSDFVKHVKNTLEYLSHDFVDAADLATAGCKCIYTHGVITYEKCEESLAGYVARELRWARGNAQWTIYLFTKPRLPLGPRLFFSLGILNFFWPLVVTVMVTVSALLLREGIPIVATEDFWRPRTLLCLVVMSLVLPKLRAIHSPLEFNSTVLVGTLMAPALMWLRGMFFLLGAFGTKWIPRESRSINLDFEHVTSILRWYAPVALFGLVLDFGLRGVPIEHLGLVLIHFHINLLIVSPVLALVLSCPLPGRGEHRRGKARVGSLSSRHGRFGNVHPVVVAHTAETVRE